jgi:hypothetical protein
MPSKAEKFKIRMLKSFYNHRISSSWTKAYIENKVKYDIYFKGYVTMHPSDILEIIKQGEMIHGTVRN